MLQTILILIFTLIVVPIVSYNYGTPLNEIQEILLYESALIALGVTTLLFCDRRNYPKCESNR